MDRTFVHGKDGLQLSSVGKRRIVSVSDEDVRKELEKNKTKVQGDQSPVESVGSLGLVGRRDKGKD